MAANANFESFEKELIRLVAAFERGLGEFKSSGYVEAQLRDEYFFRAESHVRKAPDYIYFLEELKLLA